ncbi:hypothetical protein MAIT1_04783 [Magnetofaba australis IT-1]|uniref:Uncharacterized protein n=1 Tax=Magnetofaba australis IT-1 TaxID=1434232 RepID=A0A1Y2KAV5_9PROT|nr:hypothetical protein MAIT1_04783 [Magnetofaba australis IT-1]
MLHKYILLWHGSMDRAMNHKLPIALRGNYSDPQHLPLPSPLNRQRLHQISERQTLGLPPIQNGLSDVGGE